MAWSEWFETDTDCCQFMRKDGMKYEMIQAIWLDRTIEDKNEGLHEWVVVEDGVELTDDIDEEIIASIAPYGYSIPSLIRDYGDAANDVIAECIFEHYGTFGVEPLFTGPFDDCKKYIEEYISRE